MNMQSLEKIYREACLLDLKYKHLSDACESLLQPWPNRYVNGHIKKENTKGGRISDSVHQSDQDVASAAKDLTDLQILDNILSKAQQVREGDNILIPRRTIATSMAMATHAYGQTKRPSKKASKSSSKTTTLKTPWQPLQDIAVSSTHSKYDTGLNPTPPSTPSDNTSEGGRTLPSTPSSEGTKGTVFLLQANGQRLTMPSKYIKLRKVLTRLTSQQQGASHDTRHCEGAEHFSQRLLSEGESVLIELLLALEEWALVKKELLAITPKEKAGVSDTWQDLLRVKTKMESLVAREVSLNYLSKDTSKASPCLPKGPEMTSSAVFAYVELERVIQVTLLETQLLYESWETHFIEDIGTTVIPLLKQTSPSHDLVQCIHKLLGTKPSAHLSVDHQC
ncbi:uncharacterized protein LOC135351456 isoform X2 [Halichondria panicea]|uniref:uncharacterized protein LOC135351456 isoform X2 n=1 Tax=Halichondria panicea TaxID=6063 RepID=UPI00312B4BDE